MTFLVWLYTSQAFAQTQKNIAPSQNSETVTFNNSGPVWESILKVIKKEL